MAQKFWKYTCPESSQYDISVYHGDKTGHLIIYVGQEIIKIDFNVTTDKSYSFMIGNELIELKVFFSNGTSVFSLINKTTNTAINDITHPASGQNNYLIKSIIFILLTGFALYILFQLLM